MEDPEADKTEGDDSIRQVNEGAGAVLGGSKTGGRKFYLRPAGNVCLANKKARPAELPGVLMDVRQVSLVELKAIRSRIMERWDILQNPQEHTHADHGERAWNKDSRLQL